MLEMLANVFNLKISKWNVEEEMGYKPITTFWNDFSIAENFGLLAILDTFDECFKEWHSDIKYMTELSMVLNHKIFFWYEKNKKVANAYNLIWRKLDEYICSHFEGSDLQYYYRITD